MTREGDIGWLCTPRFDSDALFTSLLGEERHGHWSLRIADGEVVSRRYLPGTMVLETQWRSPTGAATVIELLPIGAEREVPSHGPVAHPDGADADLSDLIRSVTCIEGEVEVVQELVLRFEYGAAVPWVRRAEDVALRLLVSRWSWPLQKALVRFTTAHVDDPDQGIWEMRGEPAFFTHGRVMVWATFDRAVRAVTEHGLPASEEELAEWTRLRDRVRAEVLEKGVGPDGAFTQTYGSTEVDASLLQIPHTGFLPADAPQMLATVDRIEQDLRTEDGLLPRYRTRGQDGLPGDEHPFLVCGFWLVQQYAATGRRDEAEQLMETLLACGNDLHLFAEEYDGTHRRMIGNFPQAFSHLGLIGAVDALAAAG